MRRNTLVLLAIATMLSLGIWLYTARVVLAPQVHQTPYIPIRPAPTATVTCLLVSQLPPMYPATMLTHICRNPSGTPIQ